MRWNRISASILLALSLAIGGCTAKSLPPGTQQGVKTIGVISAVGDDLVYRNLPFFFHDEEEYHRDVSIWKIDPFITEQASEALEAQYTVVPVEFDRDAFLSKRLYTSVISAGSAPDAGPIGDIVREHVHEPKADLYLVVLCGRTSVGMSPTFAECMGVLRYPDRPTDRYYYHTVYRVALVDGHTFKPLAILDAVNDEAHPAAGLLHGSPYEEFQSQRWAAQRDQVTLEQTAWVIEEIKLMFARTLPVALRRLNLLAP